MLKHNTKINTDIYQGPKDCLGQRFNFLLLKDEIRSQLLFSALKLEIRLCATVVKFAAFILQNLHKQFIQTPH